VLWAVADAVIPPDAVDELLLIAAVWVDPQASVERLVFENNRLATRQAHEAGSLRRPALADLLEVRDAPQNPFYGAG
jgi:5,6,7,8-tetrahydromethanopterin hydro-lyase